MRAKIKILFIALLLLFPIYSFATTYSANILSGGTLTCDSDTGGEECAKGLDGNTATDWSSANTAWPHWTKYDSGTSTANAVAKLYVNVYAGAGGNYLKDWTLYGSNDNSNWFTISTGTVTNATAPAWYTFTWTPSSTLYRYHKLQGANNNHSTNTNLMVLNEWNLMTCTDCTSTTTSTSTTASTTMYISWVNGEIWLAIFLFMLVFIFFSKMIWK